MIRLLVLFALMLPAWVQGAVLPNIIVDQFGWRTGSAKVAILAQPQSGQGSPSSFTPGATYEIRRVSDNGLAASGAISTWNGGATQTQSGDKGWWADFSSLTVTGSYYLSLPGGSAPGAQSYAFDLRENAFADALKASVKMFYYQRCGTAIDAAHGGAWTHAACHLGESTAHLYDGSDQGAGTARDITGGWHDAGDYRKYVSFTFSPLWDLMQAYDFNPCAFPDDTNIPESGNGVPDILDEVKWELDWLLKMQIATGPNAGALYSGAFVTTGGSNAGDGDPSTENTVYYYANYSSAATSTGAMAFAKAARLFQPYAAAYPGYAAALQAAAVSAWTWLQAHPGNVTYNAANFSNANANVAADEDFRRRVAAAAELYRTTGGVAYQTYFDANYNSASGADNGGTYHPITNNEFWPGAASSLEMGLVSYCLAPGATAGVVSAIKTALANGAKNRVWNDFNAGTDLYRSYMWDGYYGWGSNMGKTHWGDMAVWAARLGCGTATDQAHDWTASEEYLHYIHGRNPLNWVYLSNMGPEGANAGAEQSVNAIYHGWFFQGTVYDGLAGGHIGPAPGILAGGPNGFYASDVASAGGTAAYPPAGQPIMKSFRNWGVAWPDCSWTVTEPGIYYQAAYVFLAASFVPCAGPLPTATPTSSFTPFAGSPTSTFSRTPSPSPTATLTPVCQTLLNGAETLAENGSWSGTSALRSIVSSGSAPAGAVTQGGNALYVNLTVSAAWQDQFARLQGFTPQDWSPYIQLKMDVYATAPIVAGATYTELLLRADCSSCGTGIWYEPISADAPTLLSGAQTLTWNLDFSQGTIPPGSPLSALTLVYNNDATNPVGALYIDNIRLIGACAAPTPTPTSTRTPTPLASSPTNSPSPSPSSTRTASPSPSPTGSPSATPSGTASPSFTPSASPSLSPTPTLSATFTPYAGTPTDTATSTPTPSESPSFTASPSASPSATAGPSDTPSPSFTASPSITFSPTPICPGGGFFGNSNVTTNSDLSGYIDGNGWTLPVAGQATAMQFYVASGSGQVRTAIYADSGGSGPAGLLAESVPLNVSGTGIYSVPIGPVDLLPGVYWLFIQTTAGVNIGIDTSGGAEYYQPAAFGAFPGTLSGGSPGPWRLGLLAVLCPLPTPTVTPSFSASPSASASPSISPSWTASASPSASPSPAAGSPTSTPSATPTLSPPSGTMTWTPTRSVTATLTRTPSAPPSASPTPTASPQQTATATPSRTPSAAPTASASPSATPSATAGPAATATATPPSGELVIDQATVWPNPSPLAFILKLRGDADTVEARIYSPAWVLVAKVEGGPYQGGWSRLDLPSGWSDGLAQGLYYVRFRAHRGSVVSEAVTTKLYLLR